jgi:hypothetical protein
VIRLNLASGIKGATVTLLPIKVFSGELETSSHCPLSENTFPVVFVLFLSASQLMKKIAPVKKNNEILFIYKFKLNFQKAYQGFKMLY